MIEKGTFYEVELKLEGKETELIFDVEGNFVETEEDEDNDDEHEESEEHDHDHEYGHDHD